MKIVGKYSLKNAEIFIEKKYPKLYSEVKKVIKLVDANKCKNKSSKEKTMEGQLLYSPIELNESFKKHFGDLGWKKQKVFCDYSNKYYTDTAYDIQNAKNAYREMDFLKDGLGVEVQFGKYAFMVYNICAKMTIFKNLKYINCGIEIVPVRKFAYEMSTGVSYFEQLAWDLEKRGEADIDIPVLVLGIDA